MKRTVVLVFVIFCLAGVLHCVNWSLSMGINGLGGYVSVYVNGMLVLPNCPMYGATYPFSVNVFDRITTNYSPAIMYAQLDEYSIYDNDGNLVYASGAGMEVPSGTPYPILVANSSAGTIENMHEGSYTMSPGQIMGFCDSGGLSAPYNDNVNWQTYTIYPPAGYRVKAEFLDFETEANYDWLTIYGGESLYGDFLGYYTGTNCPNTVESNSGSLTFTFTSDASNAGFGWIAQVSLVPFGPPLQALLLTPESLAQNVPLTQELSWLATPGASSYNLYLSSAYPPAYYTNTASTTCTVSSLNPGTTYYWYVEAVNDAGVGPASEIRRFDTLVPAPSNLGFSLGGGNVYLDWTAAAAPSVSYKIYRNGSFIATSATNSYSEAAPPYGSTYSYYVTASYPGAESSATNTVMVNIAPAIQWKVRLLSPGGQGWNGVGVALMINGVEPYGHSLTLSPGTESQDFPFTVHHGDAVTTYNDPMSNWLHGNEYRIYDHNDALVASATGYLTSGTSSFGSISNPIVVNENDPGYRIVMTNGSSVLTAGESYDFYDYGGAANEYANVQSLCYTVYPPAGYRVKVDLSYLSTVITDWGEYGTTADELTIYAGANTSAPMLANLFGTVGACSYVSPAGPMTFSFVSDIYGVSSGWSAQLSLEAIPPPLAPSGLAAIAAVSSISLAWSPSAEPVDAYRIYRSSYNPPDQVLADVPGTQLSHIDATAANSTTYYYLVKALKQDLLSSPTNIVSCHLLPQAEINPSTFSLNLTGETLSTTTEFTLANTGGYPYSYTLSGLDRNGIPISGAAIEGFAFMGELEGHGYYQSSAKMTWVEAKTLCEQKGGHLVTLSSTEEQNFIYQHAAYLDYGWIGFTDEVSEGEWTWVNGETVSYLNWNGGEPNNGGWWGGNEDHCIFNTDGSAGWNDAPGETPAHAILEFDGYNYLGSFAGHRYYKSNATMTWTQARTQCEQRGGHLLTLGNAAENEFVYPLAGENCWLGFTDEVSEGVWAWVNGEPVTYTAWHAGEPNNYGAGEDYSAYYITFGNQWADIDANQPYYALLEIDSENLPSLLSFSPACGTLNPGDNVIITMTIDTTGLPNGIYDTNIRLVATGIPAEQQYPVNINVARITISEPTGLVFSTTQSHAEAIYLDWEPNPSAENVSLYQVQRLGADWTVISTVPGSQTWYMDSDLEGLEGNILYRIIALNNSGGQSNPSLPVTAWKLSFSPPDGVAISRDGSGTVILTWQPVTQALDGSPATPTRYLVYASETPDNFSLVGIVNDTTWSSAPSAQTGFYYIKSYSGKLENLPSLSSGSGFFELDRPNPGITAD